MKQLIVRADDLGYSEGISLGILAAHRDGIVTCTSVMVNMPYAKRAVAHAKKYPNLSLGLHVNVTNGKCVAPKEEVPSLVDEKGVFLSSSYRRQQIKNGQVVFSEEDAYMEAKAQLALFKEMVGRNPDYIDVHVLEEAPLVNAIRRVYQESEIEACPYADENMDKVASQVMAQYDFYKHDTCNFVKLFEDGHFVFDHKVALLVCHPGFIDYYASKNTSMLEERLLDYALVTDMQVKQWLENQHIELVNFNTYK